MTGAVVIDLREDSHRDWQRLAALERCPDGATVRILVGDRWVVPMDAATWLHAHEARLSLVIEGTDALIVQRWVDAARIGLAWGEVAS